jgi:hypothetical protein
VRRVERRLGLVDELEELLARRVRRELLREQSGEDDREQEDERRDPEWTAAEPVECLPPRATPRHARVSEPDIGCGVDTCLQEAARFDPMRRRWTEKGGFAASSLGGAAMSPKGG